MSQHVTQDPCLFLSPLSFLLFAPYFLFYNEEQRTNQQVLSQKFLPTAYKNRMDLLQFLQNRH